MSPYTKSIAKAHTLCTTALHKNRQNRTLCNGIGAGYTWASEGAGRLNNLKIVFFLVSELVKLNVTTADLLEKILLATTWRYPSDAHVYKPFWYSRNRLIA